MTQTTNYLSAKQNTPHCSWLLKKLIRDPRAVWAPFFVLAFRVIGLELTTKTRFFWFTKCNTVFSTYNGAKHFELLRTIISPIIFCLWKYLTESYSPILAASKPVPVCSTCNIIIFLFAIIHSVHPPHAQLLKLLKTNFNETWNIKSLFPGFSTRNIWQTLTRQVQRRLWCE